GITRTRARTKTRTEATTTPRARTRTTRQADEGRPSTAAPRALHSLRSSSARRRQQFVDERDQLAAPKGLSEEPVGAGNRDVTDQLPRRNDDGRRGAARNGPQTLEEFVAIAIRHRQIDDDEIGVLLDLGQAFNPVLGKDQ